MPSANIKQERELRPPQNEDELLDKIRKRFDEWKDQWSEIYEQFDADMRCIGMEGPWPVLEKQVRESKGNQRPALHEDVVTQFNNTVVNQLEMNPMGIDVQPEGEGANEETAQFIADRIRQIEAEQNGQHAYLTAGKCAIEGSIGFWELETDWSDPFSWDRVIKITPILDPKTILYDPYCKKPDWSDAKGAFKLERMPHEEFRDKYPNAKIKDFQGFVGSKDYSGWLDSNTVQIAVCWYVEYETRNLLLIDDGTDEGWTIFEDEIPAPFMKRRGKTISIETDDLQDLGHAKGTTFPIMKESKRQVPYVRKYKTNGVEILDAMDWDDEEVPIMVVTGRVRFENSKRIIDSQTRKARVGQLLYDLCISTIQEECAKVPKFLWMGAEGQFDTGTNWATVHREPSAYAEYKVTTEEGGSEKPLPPPQLVSANPQIEALLALKQSILISIQNVLGISSLERKDKSAKSGKALDAIQEDMNVATYHYHNSLRMAQVRQYRIINRMLPEVENTPRDVGLRDNRGNYKIQKIQQNHYDNLGKHQVVISSAKYYQSLQEEQSEFAESLLSSLKDPTIMLAVLPDLIRMKGLGVYGDDLAQMVEAMQPPQMQQARQGQNKQVTPAMLAAIQGQAQQTVQQLQLQMQEIVQQRDALLFEKRAEAVKLQGQAYLHQLDNATKVEVAAINASVKERMDTLDAQVEFIKHITTTLANNFGIDTTGSGPQATPQAVPSTPASSTTPPASDGASGSAGGPGQDSIQASDVMGQPPETQPITEDDKIMSKMHKRHRAQIDQIKDPMERARQALPINESHAIDHENVAAADSRILAQMDPTSREAQKLRNSIEYNLTHADNHRKCMEINRKVLNGEMSPTAACSDSNGQPART